MITNKYVYPELKRLDKEVGRFYQDSNENSVPSVTTVLSNTSDKSDSIQLWRKKVGETEANRITKQSTDIGSMVHEALENYLNAGTADCTGMINDIPSIIDFKTARRMKKREWIEDYFLQGCAYANAHNVMFGTEINQVVILMVDRDLLFQEFIVKPAEFNVLTKIWKKRLLEFHNRYMNQNEKSS